MVEPMTDRVGLIGVGAMGKALLRRLRAVGIRVQAYDPSETARGAAHDGGAIVMNSPAEVGQGVQYIHVIVASDDQAIAATMGDQGVLAGAAAGTLIFLHSTVLPETTRQIAEAAARLRIDVLDAPTTAVPIQMEAGKGAFLMGGPQDLVDGSRAYLEQLGESVHHFGPLGAGNVAKLGTALINAGERVLLAEVLNLVEAGGLDLRQFLEMERQTGTTAPVLRWEKIYNIENGHARHRPSTNLFNKDIVLAAKLTETYALDAPLTQGTARTAAQWVKYWASLPKT